MRIKNLFPEGTICKIKGSEVVHAYIETVEMGNGISHHLGFFGVREGGVLVVHDRDVESIVPFPHIPNKYAYTGNSGFHAEIFKLLKAEMEESPTAITGTFVNAISSTPSVVSSEAGFMSDYNYTAVFKSNSDVITGAPGNTFPVMVSCHNGYNDIVFSIERAEFKHGKLQTLNCSVTVGEDKSAYVFKRYEDKDSVSYILSTGKANHVNYLTFTKPKHITDNYTDKELLEFNLELMKAAF